MDVTDWLAWFLEALHHAVDPAQHALDAILTEAGFLAALGGNRQVFGQHRAARYQ